MNSSKIKQKEKKSHTPGKFWIDGRVYDIDKSKVNSFDIDAIDKRFVTRFHLPKFYHHWILNNYVVELELIKKKTRTDIAFPSLHLNEKISIQGPSGDNVAEAREELHSIVHEIRSSIPPKQFIAIPTLSDDVTTNFNAFKANLLNRNPKIDGLDESIFQKPEKLHITICVLALLDSLEEEEGKRLLLQVKNDVLIPLFKDKGEVILKLQGVGSMQTNLEKCNVLYTKAQIIDEDEHFNLQSIANKIADLFYENGLVKEYKDSVKIHVTLINTKYRNSNTQRKKKWKRRIPFDASTISQEFEKYIFGFCRFNSLHLSLMSAPSTMCHDFPGFYQLLAMETLQLG